MQDQQSLCRAIIGACLDVHKGLGPGFQVNHYQQALLLELSKRGLPYEAGKQISLEYQGQEVGLHKLDLLVNNEVVLKVVTEERIEPRHYAQVRSYVRAAHKQVGLLVNFGDFKMDVRRVEV
ncbi:MAG TPA: GxxExxY protein [Candidatus Xenobia bacterium]|jgi:GxxExxY protein